MKTITSKTAKNGATLWYVDGKRVSRDKAVEADIANGRETLSKLTAGLRADPAVYNDFGIVVEMNDILGGRYSEYFYFATAQDAVTAARKIVALGSEQIARVVIDNGRPYPANERYADTVDGKLIFLNGFERFDELNNDGDDGFTGEDFLKELTVTLDINAAVKKIVSTVDKFRYLDQRHEITLTKPDSEVMWERDFRGYKGDETFLVTEVYNHPDGTLSEVFLRKVGTFTLPTVTVKISTVNRNMKHAAEIGDAAATGTKAEFDKAVTESVKDYNATFEINGETLSFEDGQVTEVASTRYEAYFTIRNGRKNFYYRGNRVSKKDFFAHVATQDKALAQRDQIAQFVTKYGGSALTEAELEDTAAVMKSTHFERM